RELPGRSAALENGCARRNAAASILVDTFMVILAARDDGVAIDRHRVVARRDIRDLRSWRCVLPASGRLVEDRDVRGEPETAPVVAKVREVADDDRSPGDGHRSAEIAVLVKRTGSQPANSGPVSGRVGLEDIRRPVSRILAGGSDDQRSSVFVEGD